MESKERRGLQVSMDGLACLEEKENRGKLDHLGLQECLGRRD